MDGIFHRYWNELHSEVFYAWWYKEEHKLLTKQAEDYPWLVESFLLGFGADKAQHSFRNFLGPKQKTSY
ncbi:MAG: hypothetical protein QXY59_04325 [Candidatus Korarchaeota archaeon]